jgi:hypothetical protein
MEKYINDIKADGKCMNFDFFLLGMTLDHETVTANDMVVIALICRELEEVGGYCLILGISSDDMHKHDHDHMIHRSALGQIFHITKPLISAEHVIFASQAYDFAYVSGIREQIFQQ